MRAREGVKLLGQQSHQNITGIMLHRCASQMCEPSLGYKVQRQGPAMRPASKLGGKGLGIQNAAKKKCDQSGQRLVSRERRQRGREDMWHCDEYTQ